MDVITFLLHNGHSSYCNDFVFPDYIAQDIVIFTL